MLAANSGGAVQVGEWTVDPALDTIARGNEQQKLEPRTMRLLLCLVESAGNVVSVDRLLTEVWTGVVVGPASVYQAVSQLRKLLHDLDAEPTYIATVPRKGYRLIAPVGRPPLRPTQPVAHGDVGERRRRDDWVTGSAATTAVPTSLALTGGATKRTSNRRRLLAIVAIALLGGVAIAWMWVHRDPPVEAGAASIVVLPFVDLTAEKTGQPFCDGLTEELTNWLSQIPTLRVVARRSAFAFRETGADARNIGRSLDTNHILEGSMRRSGDHMRVNVQLIDARNGYHLWSAEYDRPMDDTITMQEDISRSVAQNLQIRLTSTTNQRFAARRSGNAQAYQSYLQARYYHQQRTREANNIAIGLYRQVIEADPKFALAYVGLSYSLLNQQFIDKRSLGDITPEVESLIATALKLDAHLADVYAVRAALRSDQNKIKDAQDDLTRAITLNPNDSNAFAELGRLWLREGKPRDALSSFNRAVALNPLDFRLQGQLCMAYEDLARYDEAQRACVRAHDLQPDNALTSNGLFWLAWSRGSIADALRWNGESLKLAPEDFYLYWYRAELYSSLGLARQARETLEKGRAATKNNESADAALGNVAYLEGGPDALRSHLQKTHLDESRHSEILLETAYLRLLLAEPVAVVDLISRGLNAPDHEPELTDTPWSARVGESPQLNLAAAEIEEGRPSVARSRLTALVRMLDLMIDAGVERSQTYQLRAQAEALRGDAAEAMRDLTKAAALGWRRVWWAEHEPYFASLRSRQDFKSLMIRVHQANDMLGSQFTIDASASL